MKKDQTFYKIFIAYLLILIIWSTTPLAIKWSAEGVGFIAGVSLRMLIGSVLATMLCLIWYKKIPMNRKVIKVYLISGMSIYCAMMLVYFGAQYINSGLVSVIYGLSPILTSWFAIHFFVSEKFSTGKFLGAIFGIAGLAIIFKEQLHLQLDASVGILATLLSVTVHSFSAVWIKQLNVKAPALQITSGGLLFSLPFFAISMLMTLESWNLAPNHLTQIPMRSVISIVYLGIMGSVVGFMCYYYVLANLNASTVSLVTLITPVMALILGKAFNQEEISEFMGLGTGLILLGLVLHQLRSYRSPQKSQPSQEKAQDMRSS